MKNYEIFQDLMKIELNAHQIQWKTLEEISKEIYIKEKERTSQIKIGMKHK
jgi:hypothetical protein